MQVATQQNSTIPVSNQPLPLTSLTHEEQAWREKVRLFSETKIRPLTVQMDRESRIDSHLLEELFAARLMSIEVPRVYGGASGNLFYSILAIEEIARVDPGVAVYVDVQNVLVIRTLLDWGNGDQKRQFLPRLARTNVGAFALSEKEAGSDAFAMTTTATPDGNDFILNGCKYWTSSANEADVFIVFAKVEQDGRNQITAFLVERSLPGLSIGNNIEKLGIRANSTCELVLNNVRVRRENILGKPGDGERIAIEILNIGRIGIAAQLLGLAQGALEEAIAYAQQRKQFGQRIALFQGVQFPLSQMATEVEATRLLVYNAGRLVANNPPPLECFRSAAMAKYYASQVAERVASQTIEIFGGNGFTKDFPVEKFYRDAKIGKIYEGTSNMLLRSIASTLLQSSRNHGNPAVEEKALQQFI